MSNLNNLIENIKNLSIEELSDHQLDILKEQIIKLLVDIQIQKDINKKSIEPRISTDDVQLEVMQKTNVITEKSNEQLSDKTELKKDDALKPNTAKNYSEEYQTVIQTEISEEIISIYSTTKKTDTEEKTIEHTDTAADMPAKSKNTFTSYVPQSQQNSITEHIPSKIQFTINDKFRIIKKLFSNNNKAYEQFINTLNSVSDYNTSEEIIKKYFNENNWDEDTAEYQILIKQNKKRFK